MKPRNFPGRKNRRRIGALSRIRGNSWREGDETKKLISTIMLTDEARNVRTKKPR